MKFHSDFINTKKYNPFNCIFIIVLSLSLTNVLTNPIDKQKIMNLYWPQEISVVPKNSNYNNLTYLNNSTLKCKSLGYNLNISIIALILSVIICIQINIILYEIDL